MYKAYFDRNPHSIEGAFTLHCNGSPFTYKGLKIERLQARSGQKGYTATSWERGKSPIPFGKFYLWLQPIAPGTKPGRSGIGEAFPISSTVGNKDLITGPDAQQRTLIRLHGENAFPGSAGCIVLVRALEYEFVFEFLRTLGKSQKYIEIEVL